VLVCAAVLFVWLDVPDDERCPVLLYELSVPPSNPLCSKFLPPEEFLLYSLIFHHLSVFSMKFYYMCLFENIPATV